jgi:DNA-directed RNA polymerase II subunit RPB1
MMNRNLTKPEIQEIIDFVFLEQVKLYSNLPNDLNRVYSLQDELKSELEKVCVNPSIIPKLKEQLRKQYDSCKIEAGKSVGVICAQSIGEKQTQMTLNTFHAAGITVETVVTGVPRFLELLNASKDPKLSSTKLYIPKTDEFYDKDIVRLYLSRNLLELRFSDFYLDFDILEKQHYDWYKLYFKLFRNTQRMKFFENASKFIRYKINRNHLFRYKVHLIELIEKIYSSTNNVLCIMSPTNVGELHVFYDDIKQNTPVDYESDEDVPDTTTFSDTQKDISVIHNLQNTLLFGIPNIKDFYIEETETHFIVHTKGNNFIKLMGMHNIDPNLTISNNMWNIYHVLGIEATREFLIQEFSSIISSDGAYINSCHIRLLVDIMTFSGTIVSISRYGMKNDQFGALAKASFEESLDNFLKASFFSETERTTDISASIICGKRSNIGSGVCDLRLDLSKML